MSGQAAVGWKAVGCRLPGRGLLLPALALALAAAGIIAAELGTLRPDNAVVVPEELAATGAQLETNLVSVMQDLTVESSGGYRNDAYWYIDGTMVYRDYDSVSTNDLGDVVEVAAEAAGQFADFQMGIEYVRGWGDWGDVAWSVAPAGIGAIDAAGYLATSNAGIATVTATLDGTTRSKRVPLRYVAGDVTAVWRAVPGSARAASGATLDAAIAAAAGTNDTALLSIADHTAALYARNAAMWAAGADLSGVVIATKQPGGAWGLPQWHGTLIAPRHIILPKHCVDGVPYEVATITEQVGARKRFLGRSGTLYERAVLAHYDPYGDPAATNLTAWGYGRDAIVGLLDSALPTNDVAVYPVMPANWQEWFPNGFAAAGAEASSEGSAVCGLWINFWNRVYAVEFASVNGWRGAFDGDRQALRKVGIPGDSGRPCFMWLPDQLVLLWGLTYPAGGYSWALDAEHRARIAAILAEHGESLTDADLSDYANYGGAE